MSGSSELSSVAAFLMALDDLDLKRTEDDADAKKVLDNTWVAITGAFSRFFPDKQAERRTVVRTIADALRARDAGTWEVLLNLRDDVWRCIKSANEVDKAAEGEKGPKRANRDELRELARRREKRDLEESVWGPEVERLLSYWPAEDGRKVKCYFHPCGDVSALANALRRKLKDRGLKLLPRIGVSQVCGAGRDSRQGRPVSVLVHGLGTNGKDLTLEPFVEHDVYGHISALVKAPGRRPLFLFSGFDHVREDYDPSGGGWQATGFGSFSGLVRSLATETPFRCFAFGGLLLHEMSDLDASCASPTVLPVDWWDYMRDLASGDFQGSSLADTVRTASEIADGCPFVALELARGGNGTTWMNDVRRNLRHGPGRRVLDECERLLMDPVGTVEVRDMRSNPALCELYFLGLLKVIDDGVAGANGLRLRLRRGQVETIVREELAGRKAGSAPHAQPVAAETKQGPARALATSRSRNSGIG